MEEDIGKDLNLLVVEDSPTQAIEIQYLLENHNYNVLMAADGEQALAILENTIPDIIISDIVMPNMDGYQLCNEIRRQDRLKDIPVMLLTSLSDPEDIIKGLVCGANNFIVKPFSEEFLLSRIKYILINKKLRQNVTPQVGIEIFFREKIYFLSSERVQMIDLLLSTYEAAFQKNSDFQRVNEELEQAKNDLEKRVQERTAELSKSNIKLQNEIEERKNIEKALRRSENELAFKNQISQAFITSPGIEVFNNILQIVLDASKSQFGIFGYIDDNGDLVCPSMTSDVWEECEIQDKGTVFHRKSWPGILGQAINQMKTLYSNKPFMVPNGHIRITRALVVPIIHDERGIGNLMVGNKETDYDAKDVRLMESIAEHLAPLLDARLLRDKQEEDRQHLEDQLRQTQKMEAIGRLAGGVAHDFNNILTIIMGHANLILSDFTGNDLLREDIGEIKTAAERAAALTRQLLIFSRKQIVQAQVVDLNAVFLDMKKMLGRLIGEDIELLIVPGTDLWKVRVDPGQMEQIVMNMVVNARDAMPVGGKLTIETANRTLDSRYLKNNYIKAQPGSYVEISVSDTGTGMDKEILGHIFEPFYTTKELGKGTGLGLSTVYGIIQQSAGFIWASSQPGQGTVFKIYLPQMTGVALEEKKKLAPVEEFRGSETILLVEDDPSLRKLAKTILKQNGYTIFEAENGEDALALNEKFGGVIDLLLTDVVMPKLSGPETAKQLQPLHPLMKVIYMSGYTDDDIVHRGVLDPGINFMEKPFSPKTLLITVKKILNEKVNAPII